MPILYSLALRCLLCALVALNPRSMTWRSSGWSLIMVLTVWSMTTTTTGQPQHDYALGIWSFGTLVLDSVRMLLLTQPLREFRHISDKVPAHKLPFLQRFFWIMSTTGRGIGWSFEDKHCTRPVDLRHRARAAFVASRLRSIFVLYILLDATYIYLRCSPVFLSRASVSVIEQGYFLRCINGLVFFFVGYAGLTISYNTLAVIAVAINLHQPALWPPPFGHLKDLYTIRKFWGRVWHQFTRHQLTIFGPHRRGKYHTSDPVSSSGPSRVRSERESWAESYRRICNAFLCSAFLHMCGDAMLQIKIWKNASSASSRDTHSFEKTHLPIVIGFSAPFFFLQPVGILIEDVAMAVGKCLGLKAGTWTKVVGYVWMLTWMTITSPPYLSSLKAASQAAYPALYERDRVAIGGSAVEEIIKIYFGIDLASLLCSRLASQ